MKKHSRLFILFIALIPFLSGCTKTDPLVPPVAKAGNSQIIQLPVSSVAFTGTAQTTNGTITGYLWSLVAGPNVPIIVSPSAASTVVNGMISGTYLFQFLVTDNAGLTGIDTISVLVKPSLIQTLTLQPANNLQEASVDGYYHTGNGVGTSQVTMGAWTHGGAPENNRTYLHFDYTSLPANAIITSAKLSLYATHSPASGDFISAHSGTGNACYIQRTISPWDGTTISWDNQPSTTTANQVTIPQSNSSFEDLIDLDVTQLVKDMLQNTNYGFALRLQSETIYNIRQYNSSYTTNVATRPKLIITYTY